MDSTKALDPKAIVDAIFEDLRDRRFLKWIFSELPTIVLHDSDGEPLPSLDAEVQQEIKDAWERIIAHALSEQPAPDHAGLTYGQKLIAEAIEAHFGERIEDYDEDVDDTSNRDAWEAFAEAIAALSRVQEPVADEISPYEWLAQEWDRRAILRKMWSAYEVAAMIRNHDIERPATPPAQGEAAQPAADGWRNECATEGCDKPATVYFQCGDGSVGSHYCCGCYMRVQALPASPVASQEGGREQ